MAEIHFIHNPKLRKKMQIVGIIIGLLILVIGIINIVMRI